jgi:hypothetical protein
MVERVDMPLPAASAANITADAKNAPAADPAKPAPKADAGAPKQPADLAAKPAPTTDRPEWLPSKFENPQKLLEAYQQLESKLGKGDDKKTDAAPGLTEAEMAKFGNEVVQTGALSKESYDALEKKGIPRPLVDAYIAGQQAQGRQLVESAHAAAGGPDQYKAMIAWALENVPKEELGVFNEAVNSGSQSHALAAVKGLAAQYLAAGAPAARAPAAKEFAGTSRTGGAGGGESGYTSNLQMQADMNHPLYLAGDPAFHAAVDRKIAATPEGTLFR